MEMSTPHGVPVSGVVRARMPAGCVKSAEAEEVEVLESCGAEGESEHAARVTPRVSVAM